MGIELHLTGERELIAAIKARRRKVVNATPRALRKAATIVKRSAVAQLSLTSHPPGTPTPSSPGQPPSLVSGDLRRSIEVDGPYGGRVAFGSDVWSVDIGPTAVYARIQELGGQAGRGATLPARPYMAPALRDARGDIADSISSTWESAWT